MSLKWSKLAYLHSNSLSANFRRYVMLYANYCPYSVERWVKKIWKSQRERWSAEIINNVLLRFRRCGANMQKFLFPKFLKPILPSDLPKNGIYSPRLTRNVYSWIEKSLLVLLKWIVLFTGDNRSSRIFWTAFSYKSLGSTADDGYRSSRYSTITLDSQIVLPFSSRAGTLPNGDFVRYQFGERSGLTFTI